MSPQTTIRAVFEDFAAFERALHALKESGAREYEAYGPTNLEEIESLMPKKGSPVRIWSTGGAFTGLAIFWLMCVLTSVIYSLTVGGKPPIANVPYVIPAYEGTILAGALLAFAAGLIYMFLGFHPLPRNYNPRYSSDQYGVEVRCETQERENTIKLLTSAGARAVDEPS